MDSESRVAKYLCKLYSLKFQLAIKENGKIDQDIHNEVLKSVVREYLSTLGWDENRLRASIKKIDDEIISTDKIHIKDVIHAIFEQQWPFFVHHFKSKQEVMSLSTDEKKRIIEKRYKIIDDSFHKIIGSKLSGN
jgi:hypothetical protein